MSVPHAIADCYGSRLHCYYHGVDEPEAGAFRICLECGHVYATEMDVCRAWREELPGSFPFTPATDIPACAYCGHDW